MGRRQTGWLKLYYSVLDDKKIMGLPEADRWLWIELLCIAGERDDDGFLPSLPDIAFRLYRSVSVPPRLEGGAISFVERNLIDKVAGGPTGYRLRIHDWDDWQPKSTTSTERVKRFRERGGNADETRSSRAPAKTDTLTNVSFKTDRPTAHAREPASPDLSISNSQNLQQKGLPLRPMFEPPEEPEDVDEEVMARAAALEARELGARPRPNGGPPKIAQHEHAAFLVDHIVANYERSLSKGVNRARVTALWEALTAAEQAATAEGFLVWLLESGPKPGEPYDAKFVKGLDKLLEEGTLGRRKIGPPEVDRFGKPLADIRPKVLAAWLNGEAYGPSQI